MRPRLHALSSCFAALVGLGALGCSASVPEESTATDDAKLESPVLRDVANGGRFRLDVFCLTGETFHIGPWSGEGSVLVAIDPSTQQWEAVNGRWIWRVGTVTVTSSGWPFFREFSRPVYWNAYGIHAGVVHFELPSQSRSGRPEGTLEYRLSDLGGYVCSGAGPIRRE